MVERVGTKEVVARGDDEALGVTDTRGETDADTLKELLPVAEPELVTEAEGETDVD